MVDRLRVDGVADLLDDGVEAVVVVGRVLDHADRAVGLVHAVGALDYVAVALLVRGLDVAGVGVVHTVVVRVFGVGLRTRRVCVSESAFPWVNEVVTQECVWCFKNLLCFLIEGGSECNSL